MVVRLYIALERYTQQVNQDLGETLFSSWVGEKLNNSALYCQLHFKRTVSRDDYF
jgi:hypothetical protein